MNRVLALVFVVATPALAFARQAPAPAPAPAPAAVVSGTWAVAQNIGGTAVEMKCTITQKDADLSGTCASDQGTLAITGKVDGKNVTWQFGTDYNGQALTIVLAGTLDTPEKIAGTVDVRPMGVSGDFTATKAK